MRRLRLRSQRRLIAPLRRKFVNESSYESSPHTIGGTAHAANSTYFFRLCFGQPARSSNGPGTSGWERQHHSAGRTHLGTCARCAAGRSGRRAIWQSSKKGPFAIRFKFPAGYEIPTHSHATDEFLTVVSGKARMAFGKDADAAHTQPFPTGAFMILPAGSWHHLWSDAETIIELHSTGPFSIKLAK